jgi:hypothetical protein
MDRVDLERAVADAIEEARAVVKSRKGPRAARRVGAYRVGKKIFACIDGEHVFVIEDDESSDAPIEEVNRCARSDNDLTTSFEFSGISIDALNALLTMFCKVAAS